MKVDATCVTLSFSNVFFYHYSKLLFPMQKYYVSVTTITACTLCSSHYIEECSDFKAGNALRSASRFHKLDETALFGSACRHEIPLYFFNLKHGERYNDEFKIAWYFYSNVCYRLEYAVCLIEHLLNKLPRSSELHVMYDIACNI